MRPIKFRAKNINGVWYYGCLVYSNELDAAIYFQTGNGSVKVMDWVYVNPETVGQFTGLLDKNGKEIYEGDILDFNGITVEVRFVRGVFAFLANGDLDEELCGDCRTDLFAKVIGNIHDNPEQLKGGEKCSKCPNSGIGGHLRFSQILT